MSQKGTHSPRRSGVSPQTWISVRAPIGAVSSIPFALLLPRLALLLLVLLLLFRPALSEAQQLPDDMLQKAAQTTGRTKEQIQQMYETGAPTGTTPADTTQPLEGTQPPTGQQPTSKSLPIRDGSSTLPRTGWWLLIGRNR